VVAFGSLTWSTESCARGDAPWIRYPLDQAAIGLGADFLVVFMRDTLPLDRSPHDLWRVVRALGTFDSLLISLILSGTITLPLSVRIGANLVAQIESTIVAVSPFLPHVPVVLFWCFRGVTANRRAAGGGGAQTAKQGRRAAARRTRRCRLTVRHSHGLAPLVVNYDRCLSLVKRSAAARPMLEHCPQ
jgi:hypothetical protein